MEKPPPGTMPSAHGTLRLHGALIPDHTDVPNWLMDLFMEQPGVTNEAKLLFLYLMRYAGRDGACFPGHDRLAENMHASRFSIMRWMKELQAAGMVIVHRRGLGLTNEYVLCDPRQAPEVAPVQHQDRSSTPATSRSSTGATTDVAGVPPLEVAGVAHKIDSTGKRVVSSVESKRVEQTTTARARENPSSSPPPPIPLAPDNWTGPLIERLDSALVHCALTPVQKRALGGLLMRLLGQETPEQRERFVGYVLSSDHLAHTEQAGRVAIVLEEDWAGWVRRGRPATKAVPAAPRRERKGALAAAARPWRTCCRTREGQDHDAQRCVPTMRHIAEAIRRHQGDDDADRYLHAHGLVRDDDD